MNAWRSVVARSRTHRRSAAAVTLLIGAIPALYIGWFVSRYGVEVPSMDDWEIAPLIAKAHSGELAFADFFKQEEEARMIVPKFFFLLSASDGHWDVRDEMMISVVVCVLTALGIFVLLLRTDLTLASTAFCFWLISLLIFTPAQFELWLFASGFPSYMPVLFIVLALLTLGTRWSLGVKFAICALLATMSTFTLAHGLLAWGLTFPGFLAIHRPRAWKRWLTCWTLVAAAAVAIYFYGYRKPAHLPDFAPVISVVEYAQFLLAFLGATLAYAVDDGRAQCAVAVGAAALALFVLACAYTALRWKDAEFVRRAWPWAVLGWYSVASGVLATLGRVGFGLEYAISSRYVTFSLYLLVAVVVLSALIGRELWKQQRSVWGRGSLAALGIALAVTGLGLFSSSVERTLRIMHSIAARNRLARSAIAFSPVLDTSGVIKRINYPAPEVVKSRAAQLDELQLLRPRLVRSNSIASLRHQRANGRTASGWLDAIVPVDAEQSRASGWASLNGKGRPADAVVLAYQSTEGEWVIFAMSDTVVRRRDIARLFDTDEQLWSGWIATFPRNAVPPGATISAWAVDIDKPRLYRLSQNVPELKL